MFLVWTSTGTALLTFAIDHLHATVWNRFLCHEEGLQCSVYRIPTTIYQWRNIWFGIAFLWSLYICPCDAASVILAIPATNVRNFSDVTFWQNIHWEKLNDSLTESSFLFPTTVNGVILWYILSFFCNLIKFKKLYLHTPKCLLHITTCSCMTTTDSNKRKTSELYMNRDSLYYI